MKKIILILFLLPSLVFSSEKKRLALVIGNSNYEKAPLLNPANESLEKVLVSNNFFNLMQTDIISGIGSYNYRGTWNWLDQIILSKNFVYDDLRVQSGGSFIYNFTSEDDNIGENYIFYKNSSDEVYPSRTFGGDNWFGGFSDHLPIFSRFGFICR